MIILALLFFEISAMASITAFFKSSKKGKFFCTAPPPTSIKEISAPSNFKRNIHVAYDKEKQQFVGLPEVWEHMIKEHKITYVLSFSFLN